MTLTASSARAKRHAVAFRAPEDPAEAEALWELRRTCSQAMFALGDAKLNEDVVVPIRSYVDLLRFTREIRARFGLATPTFGHAADGNFHVHIMYDRFNRSTAARPNRPSAR